jgi:hypothetical protein
MTRSRTATISLAFAASSSCLMGAYHFFLPSMFHWDRFVTKAAGTREGLGDYFVSARDPAAAIHSYESALQKEPNRASVKRKLAKLGKG